ncbi:NUDIX domain-containing protein [Nocardioides mangrovicus]|uniref:NUDIX domain-containing protein n=1 Tax=Nocardioides mangrovicus TaxID=2478913 RepID=A0A3L8P7Z0_9ACTN|nr:NUDIX hydrolase [Nocardioides mangrovicus]RLV50903.1 NUDIX domain-containing protein [Nocardioides mangrovicus]
MSLRDDALATLLGWQPPDAGQEVLRATYVEQLSSHADALWRDGRLDHLTASAVVLDADRRQVLLTLHRKANRWFQLGGHLEPADPTLADAALREATEESGIDGLLPMPGPVQLDVHEVPFCRPGARHLDVRYVLHAPPGAQPTVSAESHDVRWWPVGELPDAELEPLVRLAVSR